MIFRHFQVRLPSISWEEASPSQDIPPHIKWVNIYPSGIRWENLENLDPPSEEDRHITWRNIR